MDTFGPKAFKEGGGLVQQFGTVTLMNRAPHPNAAKVFINWLLSRKGQICCKRFWPTPRARQTLSERIFPRTMCRCSTAALTA